MKKIKVFLGAFVNQTNAQNLSCRTLAEFLDKEKFEVYTLEIKHGNLSSIKMNGVNVFSCFFPVKVTALFGLIWGYHKSDIVYTPRGDFYRTHKALSKIFKAISFKTVRNVLDDTALNSAVSHLYKSTGERIADGYNYVDFLYAMTPYMRAYNEEKWGVICEKRTLIPPSDLREFKKNFRIRKSIKHVIFIGNDWERKGLRDFLVLSSEFKDIDFHIVGRGNESDFINSGQNDNVTFHGLLIDHELLELMTIADLHILPSKSEGLPRVWIESLANGLPSIMYYGYGLEDYLENDINGVMVPDLDQLIDAFSSLLGDSKKIETLSVNAFKSSERFDMRRLVLAYEDEMMRMIG